MATATLSNNIISSGEVQGTAVFDPAGKELGSIDELMIDKQSGKIRYAVLEFGGLLRIGTERYPLPWNMLKYDTRQDAYVVAMNKETLDKAPRYAESDAPSYTDEYNRRVHDYYGVGW